MVPKRYLVADEPAHLVGDVPPEIDGLQQQGQRLISHRWKSSRPSISSILAVPSASADVGIAQDGYWLTHSDKP